MKVRIYEKCQIMEVINSKQVFFALSEEVKFPCPVDPPPISLPVKTESFPIKRFGAGNFVFVDKDLRNLIDGLEETIQYDQERIARLRQLLDRMYNLGFWNRLKLLWSPKKVQSEGM